MLRHNRLRLATELGQSDIPAEICKEFCEIFKKHNAQSRFYIRDLHRHLKLPDRQISLRTRLGDSSEFWIAPAPIDKIDPRKLRPHIISVNAFKPTENECEENYPLLSICEFREGPPVDLDSYSDFLREFADCIRKRRFEDTYGLELADGQPQKMFEFSSKVGSVLLREDMVEPKVREGRGGQLKLQCTTWAVTVKDGSVDAEGNMICIVRPDGNHPRGKDSVECPYDFMNTLRDEGYLVSGNHFGY